MRIGFLFNCQGAGIASALERLLPGCSAFSVHFRSVRDNPARQAEFLEHYRGCDHVITRNYKNGAGPLGAAVLRGEVRNLHILTPLNFRGFHPDMTFVNGPGGAPVVSATGSYHSRIGIAAFLAGIAAHDAAMLYNGLMFRRLGYLRAYEEDFGLLQQSFRRDGIDAAELVAALRVGGCFMHSMNHPKIGALGEMARLVCRMLGEHAADVELGGLPDALAPQPSHPVFPEIARAAGVTAEGAFTVPGAPDEGVRPVTLDAYLQETFAMYETCDKAVLRAADGVMDVVSAIGAA